jgi:apolipoprotein N-acyltransferase
MVFASRTVGLAVAVAAALATAVLVWFGEGLRPWWPLAWLAPLPVLWYSLRANWWATALTSMLGWLLGNATLLNYFLAQGMSLAEWLGNFATLSAMATAGTLLFRLLVVRGAVWSAMLALPALWVSVDWLRYWITPHGTSADLAYTQLEFLPFLQLASLTGPWGMSFLLLLVPSAAILVLHLRRTRPREAIQSAGAVAAIVAMVLGYGALRLAGSGQPASVMVGLLASDGAHDHVADPGPDAQQLFAAYAAQARLLLAAGAQLIVMPEKVAAVSGEARTDSTVLQPLADGSGALLVAGSVHLEPGPDGMRRYNRATVFAPQAALASYDKEHLLPPFESPMTPGTAKLMVQHGGTNIGIAICKDMDFTSTSIGYGALGAQLVLVPAWDFGLDRVWHGHMAIMRGVEGGFSVARTAKEGNLTVSDDRGRIVAEVRSDAAPFASLLTAVPVGHEATLFQRWGNWFAWAAVALLAMVLVRAASVVR